MTPTQRYYDPRGIVETQAPAPAARARSVKGLRLAILDNTKWNVGTLLRGMQGQPCSDTVLAAIHYCRKPDFNWRCGCGAML
jgi:hypothetical protein